MKYIKQLHEGFKKIQNCKEKWISKNLENVKAVSNKKCTG